MTSAKDTVDWHGQSVMKTIGNNMALSLLGLSLTAWPLPAQDVVPAQPVVVERPSGRVLQPEAPGGTDGIAVVPGTSELTPARSQSGISPEIRHHLRRFYSAREAYLREQEQLEKELKGATETDRKRVRERIQVARDAWLKQSKAIQQEATERQREIKRTLPKHGAALDETRKELRGKRPVGLD